MSEANGKVKYPGQRVMLGEVEYVMPSLSVKQAKDLWPKIIEINKGVTTENLPEKYDIMIEMIHAALSRNYPDIKMEDLMEVVDLRNIRYLNLTLMGQTGLDAPPGLVPAATTPVAK